MKTKISLFIAFTLLMAFAIFLFLPTLRYGFYGLPVLLVFSTLAIITVQVMLKIGRLSKVLLIGILLFTAIYLVIIPLFTTWALFKSEDYKNLIGKVKTDVNFDDHVAPISTEEIRIVDWSMAYRLGDKVLGSVPSLGSQVDLGDFTIQKVNNKLYWVAPLLHSGFFKWNKNSHGTPGYVMVSATNDRDIELVQEIKGKPINIKYQPNAYFFDNLKRHIYLNGYSTVGYTDFTFEIDDDGLPYWVVTLYEKTIGFGGKNATGIIVVNAETGDIKEYGIENAPSWVDRIQPLDFVSKQLLDWGEYINGYWNFSNEGKLTLTEGITLVYGANDKSYWYSGLTSVGSDEGTVGFVLVDTRTKETFWFKQVGATETAAQRSAMGKVQEKGYMASFPITYNINGLPTYVMSLKDQAGLVKMIAMVSVEDYTIVGVGNNVKEALRAYKNAFNSQGNAIAPNSFSTSKNIRAEIERISSDIQNGSTLYYLILKEHDNKIFVGSTAISNELPISIAGDSVSVFYDDGANEIVDMVNFDNLKFTLQKTNAQKRKEETFN